MTTRKYYIAATIGFIVAASAALIYRYPIQFLNLFGRKQTAPVAAGKPQLPGEPKDADAQLKAMYQKALKDRAARLKDPEKYDLYLTEGLDWKTVGDFAKSGSKDYYNYAALVYSETGDKFDKEWLPWFNAGNMFQLMKGNAEAEQAYKKAVDKDPTRFQPLYAMIEMLGNAKVQPNDDIKKYYRDHLPKVGDQRTALIISYVKYLLESGTAANNAESLDIMRIASTEWAPKDARLKAEYADLQKALKK